MIEVGDKLSRRMQMTGKSGATVLSRESFPGTVIYVHPEHHWFTAELTLPGGRCRESFFCGEKHGREEVSPAWEDGART